MSGFAHDVAGGNGNLIVTALQSPNFVTGVTGWQIAKNGDVEFNNGVFRGTIAASTFEGTDFAINSLGEFFYSGTPALGNLIAAIANVAGSSDGHVNSYPAGISSLLPSGTGTPALVAQMYQGSVNFGSLAAVNFAGGKSPASVIGEPTDGVLELTSGTQSALDNSAGINILSELASGNNQPLIQVSPLQLIAPNGTPTGSGIFIWPSSSAAQLSSAKGFSGTIPVSQTDTTPYTVTAITPTKISNVWTIPANDAIAGTVYRLTAAGTATWGSTQQALTFDIAAFGQTITTLPIGATEFTAGLSLQWRLTCDVVVALAGATATVRGGISLDMGVSGANELTNAGTTQSAGGFASYGAATNASTTAGSNITLQAKWASATGASTITSDYNYLERLGA